jgi:hypothetical protein
VAHELGIPTIGVVLVAGPGLAQLPFKPLSRAPDPEVVLASDDWPFFYAEARSVPREYLVALGLILAVSTLVVWRVAGEPRASELHFFCLGVGFMLLETRNITGAALVFGSTWQVNAIVFASILVMAMASALLTGSLARPPIHWVYAGLFASLVLNRLVPLQSFASAGLPERVALVGGLTALPLFFSGIVFAHSFKFAADPPRALAANILGGVLGGVLEYLGMVTGLGYLMVLVALFYLLSWLFLVRRDTRPGPLAA